MHARIDRLHVQSPPLVGSLPAFTTPTTASSVETLITRTLTARQAPFQGPEATLLAAVHCRGHQAEGARSGPCCLTCRVGAGRWRARHENRLPLAHELQCRPQGRQLTAVVFRQTTPMSGARSLMTAPLLHCTSICEAYSTPPFLMNPTESDVT